MFTLPPPLQCVSLGSDDPRAPLRTVLLVRCPEKEAPPELVVLRSVRGVKIHLAAIVDRKDRVLEWLEWWVQCSQELETLPLARRGVLCNAVLDRAWAETAAALAALDATSSLASGWEQAAPEPLVIDATRRTLVRLVHPATGRPLRLCRNDETLAKAGLGPYSSTLERWFTIEGPDGAPIWFAGRDLLANDAGQPTAIPDNGGGGPILEFNSGAGQMLLRRHHPVGIAGFLAWIDGGAVAESGDGAAETALERQVLQMAAEQSGPPAHLFATHSPALESAFIRLQLWRGMIRAVREAAESQGTPFLNLSLETFRVSFPLAADALPMAWNFRVHLTQPGDAVPLEVAGRLYGFSPSAGASVLADAPGRFGGWWEGGGTVRFKSLAEETDGRCRLEGTLDGPDTGNAKAGSWLSLRVLLDGKSVTFAAFVEKEQMWGRVGVAFAAPAVELPPGIANRLKTALGSRLPCQFLLVRPLSPSYDLFSLGVVGIQIFLTPPEDAVDDCVDDLLELAALLPPDLGPASVQAVARRPELAERLQRILSLPRWAAGGPDAPALPAELWSALLGELVEFLTAENPADPATAVAAWLALLRTRQTAVDALTSQVRALLIVPRADHEEIARVVHHFV